VVAPIDPLLAPSWVMEPLAFFFDMDTDLGVTP
jgi:hypothetical protein